MKCKSQCLAGFVVVFTAVIAGSPAKAGTYLITELKLAADQKVISQYVNDHDQVVGYVEGPNRQFGFIWKSGTFIKVAKAGGFSAINDAGIAVGDPATGSGGQYVTYDTNTGKLRTHALTIENADFPILTGINEAGVITGSVFLYSRPLEVGFVSHGKHDHRLVAPGAKLTSTYGISDSGVVAVGGGSQAFTYSNGTFSPIMPPNADFVEPRFTRNDGLVGGSFASQGSINHGFTLSNGDYSIFDYPNALGTSVFGVTTTGTVIGSFVAANDTEHAFIYSNGVYTRFTPPDAGEFHLIGVNTVGSIIGQYLDSAKVLHTILATCAPDQQPCTH